jgi:hypothetical protein
VPGTPEPDPVATGGDRRHVALGVSAVVPVFVSNVSVTTGPENALPIEAVMDTPRRGRARNVAVGSLVPGGPESAESGPVGPSPFCPETPESRYAQTRGRHP